MFCYLGKYNLQFWQTCFVIWKNPFSNCDMWWPDRLEIISTTFLVKSQEKCIFQFDTNILQFGEIYLASLTNIFAIFRNTFVNSYILIFECLDIWTLKYLELCYLDDLDNEEKGERESGEDEDKGAKCEEVREEART